MRLKSWYPIFTLMLSVWLIQNCQQMGDKSLSERIANLKGPYLGQRFPGEDPALFAPGIVSTGLGDGVCGFGPGGKELVFQVMYYENREWRISIVSSQMENGRWTVPDFVSFTDRQYMEAYPFLSYDGSELYFTTNRPTNDPVLNDEYNFWVARKTGNEWNDPVPMSPPINGNGNVSGISLTTTGTAYYTLMTDDEQAIYRSRLENGTYSEPERLPEAVNSAKAQFDGVIAPDESYMILPVYGREDAFGSTDLYVTFRDENDNWTPAVNLGEKVNTKFTESAARITADGKYILYTGHSETHNWGNDSLSYSDVLNYQTRPEHGNFDAYWMDASYIDQFRPRNIR